MPIYEYHCEPCDRTFETLIRRDESEARCPNCGNPEVTRCLSAPASARVTGGGSASAAPALPMMGGGCGRTGCGPGGCAGMN